MTSKSVKNGHEIFYDEEKKQWKYLDNETLISEELRDCKICEDKKDEINKILHCLIIDLGLNYEDKKNDPSVIKAMEKIFIIK